jgi:hypothetical protein
MQTIDAYPKEQGRPDRMDLTRFEDLISKSSNA